MTEKDITYATITPKGVLTFKHASLDVGAVQDEVGGDFEVLPSPREQALTLLANTDGKNVGLEANWPVTVLIRRDLNPNDFVTGTVFVAGPSTPDGDLTSLDDDAIDWLRDAVGQGE